MKIIKGNKYPVISIVMPVYNAEEYLAESLGSLLEQSFKDFEVICVDDGSVDGSLRILEEYSKHDGRIRIVRQQHASAAQARNTGIENIRGKYFTILDADDTFLPDMLQKLYNQMEKTDADVCLCAANTFDAKTGKFYGRPEYMLRREYLPCEVFSWRDNRKNFFQCCGHFTWNRLYRSEFIKDTNIKFQDSPPNEDAVFSCCTLAAARRITYVDEALLNYRINNDKSMVAKEGRYPESLMMVARGTQAWLKENGLYEGLKESFEKRMYQWGYHSKLKSLKKTLSDDSFKQVCAEFNDFVAEFGRPLNLSTKERNTCQISVIIPVYNVEKYVCQCVDSILNQTFKDIEIILIDDNSTDGSYDKLLLTYAKNNRVNIFHNQNNLGGGETRNFGLKLAKGKYVYFVDSDDVLLPGCLEYLYRIAERYNADMVHLSERYDSVEEEFDLNKNVSVKIKRDMGADFLHRMPLGDKERIMCYVNGIYFVPPWTNFYRRSFLLHADIKYPLGIFEDQLFAAMAYAATDRIWSAPGAFYIYRQVDNSVVHAKGYNKITKLVESLIVNLRMVQEMPDKATEPLDEDFMSQVYMRIFNVFFSALPSYYDGGGVIPEEIYDSVDKAVRKYFPKDAFLLEVLLHYACSEIEENKKKVKQIKVLNQRIDALQNEVKDR